MNNLWLHNLITIKDWVRFIRFKIELIYKRLKIWVGSWVDIFLSSQIVEHKKMIQPNPILFDL